MKILIVVAFLTLAITFANGQTPATQPLTGASDFLQACEKGDAKLVGTMLQSNPQLIYIRQVDDGATPLHVAKNAAVAAILLENGADIEALDTQTKSSPLHWALDRELWEGKSDTAAYLIDQGAKTDDLLCLCALGKLDEIKAMVEKNPKLVDFVAKPEDQLGMTPLEVAGDYDHADLVKYLIANGADVNSKARPSTLHEVAFLNRMDIAKILLAHGIDLERIEPRYHETALGWAVYAGRTEMVKFLISRGAKVRMIDLHSALSGKAGQNQAGQGATKADYAAIEAILRPRINVSK
jgi:ankyrin repeat protein